MSEVSRGQIIFIRMESIVSTPTPGGPDASKKSIEEHNLQFQGFIFELIVFSDQEISIIFNEISTSKIHEASSIKLQNINYKTVLAALKKDHTGVISASLSYNEEKYSLNIEVKYDFLPPIIEVITFVPRVISDKDMSELEVKNYFSEIKLLKEEIAKISSCDVVVIPLTGAPGEAKVDIPKFNTIVTWSIEATSGLSNSLKIDFDYLNSKTGQTKPTKLIPGDNISVYASAGVGSVEMRFLIKPIEGFDQLYFKLHQHINGKMLIIKERV